MLWKYVVHARIYMCVYEWERESEKKKNYYYLIRDACENIYFLMLW